MKALALLLLAVASLAGQKRVYIANDDHTDYLWAQDEATMRAAFLEMLDYYLAQADATAGNPSDYQGRFNCDGTFWLWTYERNRPAKDFERLIGRVRDGHITVPITPLNQSNGGVPAEAVLRGMYYGGALERRYGLRFPLAMAMEDQTLPYGLGALWAGAGARYSWRGICDCATRMVGSGNREHDIYWWVGPDGSRILMKWNSLLGDNMGMGGYAEARNPAKVVEQVTSEAESNGFRKHYPYDVIGAFGKGWDDLKTLTDEFIRVARDKSDPTRRVIVSNELDFFQDFEKTYGRDLPTVSASFGNEWDVYVASMAETSARVKRSLEKLRTAEALATLVSLRDPAFMDGRKQAGEQTWMNLGMYWEHDWEMDGALPRQVRVDWQKRTAGEIERYVDELDGAAAKALGGMIPKGAKYRRFYAFNPLSWVRTDVVDLPVPGAVHVLDLATGREVPSQRISESILRVLASDVPAVGYKVFEVRPGAGRAKGGPKAAGSALENEYYRVVLDGRGAITSLVDKRRGELVRAIDGRAANDLGSGTGRLEIENAGPVSVTLKATSAAPLKHTTRITLVRGLDRVGIENRIEQNFDSLPEWTFSFNLDAPQTRHEEVGAILRAARLDKGGDYATRNARTDWLTLNHFADMSSGGRGVTLANSDCFFMRLGRSTLTTLDTATPQISVLAGGQVDGPKEGAPGQGGDSLFLQRFALRGHAAYDQVEAMRFALEQQNPLRAGEVTGGKGYPETSLSFVQLSNALLWALKPAEGGIGSGVIARLWNVSDQPVEFTLGLPGARSAMRVTHVETDLEPVALKGTALTDTLARQQWRTYRLKLR